MDDERSKLINNLGTFSFLINASEGYEASTVESFLNQKGIPTLIKRPSYGSINNVMLGTSNLGVDIFVPSGLIHKAKEVLQGELGMKIGEESIELEQEREKADFKEKLKLLGYLFIFMIIVSLFYWIRFEGN